MTTATTSESRWKQSIENAKAEILGVEGLTAPAPLVNLATNQLVPIIAEMERLLTDAAEKIDDTAFIHMRHVKTRYVDAAIETLEDALDNTFFSRACGRFVQRYERVFAERGFTAPSPA